MTHPLSGLLLESCEVPGEILAAFNDSELPMQRETLLPVVPLGGLHMCQHHPIKSLQLSSYISTWTVSFLSLSAIKGYKALLNSIFRLKGFDLFTDQVLR